MQMKFSHHLRSGKPRKLKGTKNCKFSHSLNFENVVSNFPICFVDSGGSSEEEYVDALNELGPSLE